MASPVCLVREDCRQCCREDSEALGEVAGQQGGFLSHICHRGGGKSGKHTAASLDQDGMTCGVASFFKIPSYKTMDTSLMAQMVKNLPAMQETWVRSLGGEDPLEKEMAIHSGILAWRIPWTEEPGGLQSTESLRIRHEIGRAHV